NGRGHAVGKRHSRVLAVQAMTDQAVVREGLLACLNVLSCGGQWVHIALPADGYPLLHLSCDYAFEAAGRAYLAAGEGERQAERSDSQVASHRLLQSSFSPTRPRWSSSCYRARSRKSCRRWW